MRLLCALGTNSPHGLVYTFLALRTDRDLMSLRLAMQVALQMEASSLLNDVLNRAALRFEDVDGQITDQELTDDVPESEASSESASGGLEK